MSFLLERLDARHLFALVHCTARVLHYFFFFFFFFVYFLENTPRVDQVMITFKLVCVVFPFFFLFFVLEFYTVL